jgi:hypothetical protein
MPETGTAFSTDDRGGLISPEKPSTPVSYDAVAIAAGGGRPPREHERVIFERAPGSGVATSVRVVSSTSADLTLTLRNAFETRLEADRLSGAARAEVVRLAADRAARAQRNATPGEDVAQDVLEARVALATAAMALLAVESCSMAPEDLTPGDLRRVLRRQRPALPR